MVEKYNLPPDKRNRLSSLDIILALVPYINFIVSISYLLRRESRKRGLIMLGVSLIVNGLCSTTYRLLFVRISDIPFLTWLDNISWELPPDWWKWIILLFITSSVTIRCLLSRRLARNWQVLAKRTKLDYKSGGCLGFSRRARITGKYRKRDLLLYTYNPLLIDNIIDRTRLELKMINPSNLQMRLEYMPAWQAVNELFQERNRVKTGDDAFDAAFLLYSKDPALVSKVFISQELRLRLFRLNEFTTINLVQHQLSLECTGREFDLDYLNFCIDILCDLADVLDS